MKNLTWCDDFLHILTGAQQRNVSFFNCFIFGKKKLNQNKKKNISKVQ